MNLDYTLELVKAAKEAGADCIKTQVYRPDTITLNSNKHDFMIHSGNWKGQSLYELYEKAAMPWEWNEKIKSYAEMIGLDFLATPFDESAVDYLETLGVSAYKIASAEINHLPLIEAIASKNKPIFISTGMGTQADIEDALKTIKKYHNQICILKCNSSYPADLDEMNLETIKDMQKRYNIPIGLSDHTMDHLTAVVAVSAGAKVVEKHICLSRDIVTEDSFFSLEPEEFKTLVSQIRKTESILGEVSYAFNEKTKPSLVYRRSIYTSAPIKKGEYFTADNIKVVRPAHGLEPKYYNDVIGKRAKQDIEGCEALKWSMVE